MTQFLKTKKDITAWLDKYRVNNYALTEDPVYGYTVSVEDSVNLSLQKLSFVPIKFSVVSGDFFCDNNQLTSLEFCPENIKGDFDCSSNQLTSLEFCPKKLGDSFNCDFNLLTSLEHCPPIIGGSFTCAHNQLTSLEFCPTSVGGNFHCAQNNLSSLEFCPQKVEGYFYCFENTALGDAQRARNFTQILNLHKETLIEKEKEKLDKQLYRPQISEASSSFKI